MDDVTFTYNASYYQYSQGQTEHSYHMRKSLEFISISTFQSNNYFHSLSPAHEKYKQKISGNIHTLYQFWLIVPILVGFRNSVVTYSARLKNAFFLSSSFQLTAVLNEHGTNRNGGEWSVATWGAAPR